MQLKQLRLQNVRNIAALELELEAGINLFLGENGAGKTSVLEAVYLLSHARSFRSGKRESLIRLGTSALNVFALVQGSSGSLRRVGLLREANRWSARIEGSRSEGIVELLREVAVVCFEPGSHALIAGAAEERRSFLDWGLFHVEPEFVDVSRRYRRALKQRNALLRRDGAAQQLGPWNLELAAAGESWNQMRETALQQLAQPLQRMTEAFLPELGEVTLSFQRGWPAQRDLLDALQERTERDIARGHTGAGPHRADWGLSFVRAPEREHLSRGQEKLCALACVLAQAELFAQQRGDWPVVCLDDLASELDPAHQAAVLAWLQQSRAQILLTGTSEPEGLAQMPTPITRFHVEQGHVTRLL